MAPYYSLCASALVQRSPVPTARYHLFDEEIIGRFKRYGESRDNATAFVELCLSPLCTVLPFMRSLIVYVNHADTARGLIDTLSGAINLKTLLYIDTFSYGGSTPWFVGKLLQVKQFAYTVPEDDDQPLLFDALMSIPNLSTSDLLSVAVNP